MKLNTDRLNAFYQAACDKNFSLAASNLRITQSALSQRVLKLEREVKTTLLIRSVDGVKLTEAGSILFDYVQEIQSREQQLLDTITGRSNQTSGILRIGSFSSVLRSVVMPSLTPLFKNASDVYVEFFSRELRELPTMLESGEVDLIILDDSLVVKNLKAVQIGLEELVHIRHKDQDQTPANNTVPIFLDHDAEDMTTYNFFIAQDKPDIEIQRHFYDDVYGLLDGVKFGFGEAIISRHIIPPEFPVKIVEYQNKIETPVVVYFKENRYVSKLQEKAVQLLQQNAPHHLNTRATDLVETNLKSTKAN